MIEFKTGICPRCGRTGRLMKSNNPLSGNTICLDCIKQELKHTNLEHAEFFCRTYNLPWNPELWISLDKQYQEDTFEEYTKIVLDDPANKPNLAYSSSTRDLWSRTNKEWEKCRTFAEILNKINDIRDSYVDRGRFKWGTQYTFEEILKLDSIYTRTLKANNITNPLQKEAVKTLCKLQIELDDAVAAKDAKAIKDFSSAWSTFAKQADLETMINDTKTDDITTVAELYDYMEKQGFVMKYFDGASRDEVDRAIQDIQDTNRKLILESTGLQPLLEEMARQQTQTREEEHTKEIVEENSLDDLLNFTPEDTDIETEDDAEALELEFDEEDKPQSTTVIKKN